MMCRFVIKDKGIIRKERWVISILYIQELLKLWKPMPRVSWCTVFMLMLIPEDVWTPQLLRSSALTTLTHYAPQPSCATLRSLTLHGWVLVVPKCFHFAITPLTRHYGMIGGKKFHKSSCYYSATLKFSEPFRRTPFFTNVYKGRARLRARVHTPVTMGLMNLEAWLAL